MKMDSDQKQWNKLQKEFRRVLLSYEEHEKALDLFMAQHGALHSSLIGESQSWSYEDEVFSDIAEDQIRRIPVNCEHSIAWNLWHIARIEDVTMNMLIAGRPQLYLDDGWKVRLEVRAIDTGNAMSEEDVVELSKNVNLEELRAYRLAVGHRTREIVNQLSVEDLKEKVEPSRLQKVMDVGAVVEEAIGLIEYWGNRNIAGMLLMPPTRHNFVHLNEALRLKQRRK
jgi:hypothetical protein